jgi:hypothetical protein
MSEQRPWHRLFELSLADFFQGSDVEVEPEMDLSRKQQFIDLALIRKGSGAIPRQLPDGFEDLAAHNLVTFKSYQEALTAFSLQELVGHYTHYRPYSAGTSSLLYELFETYKEDPEMPVKLKEFVQETINKMLKTLPAEKRLEGLTTEQRLEGLSPEELRAALEAAQRRLQANGSSSHPCVGTQAGGTASRPLPDRP